MFCAGGGANRAKFRRLVPSIDTAVTALDRKPRWCKLQTRIIAMSVAAFQSGLMPDAGVRCWHEVRGRLGAVRAAAYAEAGGQKDSFMCGRRPQARIFVGPTCFNEILLTRFVTQVNPP